MSEVKNQCKFTSEINSIFFVQKVLVPFVNSLIVLDADGDRLLAKYYDQRSKAEQTKTEQFLHKKTKTVSYF